MRARLLRGIGANAMAQSVTAATQLLSVPVLVHAWGGDALGLWLTLMAWTSLLSIADCGIMAAAGNAMIMAAAREDRAAAARLFGQTFRFVLTVAAALGAATLAAGAMFALAGGRDAAGPVAGTSLAAIALGLAALLGLPLGTLELGFRADGRYAAGVVAVSVVRLTEAAAILLAALAG